MTNTIPKLDATASEIVANQRDALVQRKDLAQKTKDFRKLDDASKLTEYKGLLKGRLASLTLETNTSTNGRTIQHTKRLSTF